MTITAIFRPVARKAAGIPGRFLPYPVQKTVLYFALNEAFRKPLSQGQLIFLQGRTVRIRVTDLCLDWMIRVEADRFLPIDRGGDEDVRITGNSLDFALLAARKADPDTLFFQRRIRIEGDTELGLGVKNTMDGMDWEELPAPLRSFLRAMRAVAEMVERRHSP